jgi:hypothetical protein
MIAVRSFLLSCAMLVSGVASAQWYPVPRGPKNMEVGYSYCIASADFKYRANSFNENTGILTDTGFTNHITSTSGFGGLVGYYWPVAKLGLKSRLAIDLSYMYNAYLWDGNTFSYSANSQTGTESVGSGTVEMGLPIGAEYKYGCDALFDKSERLCYSFGAGVYPSMDATVYRGDGGFSFHARPYVKAEAGFFAGICFKLRLTYVMGDIDYISYGHDNPGNIEHTSFTAKGTTMLSLVLMPMSWKFGRSEW